MPATQDCAEGLMVRNDACVYQCQNNDYVFKQKRCVERCPAGYVGLLNRTCVEVSEAHGVLLYQGVQVLICPLKHYQHNGTCLKKCPENFTQDDDGRRCYCALLAEDG